MSPFETFLSHPSAGNLLLVPIVWMLGAAGWEAAPSRGPVVEVQLENAVGVCNQDTAQEREFWKKFA